MQDHDLEQQILQFIARPGYKPVKPRVIAERMGLPKDRLADAKKAIKRLVRRGQVLYGANHLVRPATLAAPASPTGKRGKRAKGAPQGNRVVGVFHRAQKGYGFVRPKQAPPLPAAEQADEAAPKGYLSAKGGRGAGGERRKAKDEGAARGSTPPAEPQDIYVPVKWTRDAANGDLVLVQLHRKHYGDPGPRGEVIEVIERETHNFVGTYFEARGSAYVQIDGTLFAQPIYVGDPGAKGVRPDDKVVVEMVRFPSPAKDGEGVIVEVLGPRGKPGVDTLSIIREFNLPDRFAKDALDEARIEAEHFDESIQPGRLDLTQETVVTIDPPDARDFDDAISLERLDNGDWRLGVHIADVSHFVRSRTALDREAYSRGTSVYLPDRVIPMLPEVISNGLASLQPGKVRYTKSVIMDFTTDGIRTHTEFHSAAICSNKRLSYDQVDQFLAEKAAESEKGPGASEKALGAVGGPHPPGRSGKKPPTTSPIWRRKLGAKVHGLLSRMHELAMILRKRRLARGALVLHMPEVKVDLDADGRVTGAHATEDTESHQIIEEFMLATNEAVAELLRDKGISFLRRIHEAPSPHKLRALTEFIRELGVGVNNLQGRFELQRLLDDVQGKPEEHAVNYAVLRAMQRAVYGPKEEGHYALASECYCHFTSPIRRYPDLTVHRLLGDLLTGRKPRSDVNELVLHGQHCSDREQRADAAERDLTKLKLLDYLSDQVGLEMNAVVTGVESYGLFVQGVELPAEGLIHADALADDYYYFDRTTHTLTGRRSGNRYRLGDLMRVAVARVDLERRELDFRLVERKRTAEKGPATEMKGEKKSRERRMLKKKGAAVRRGRRK